ncbi:UDP-N-acetylmuramate dehydrogenase [Peptostreptococcus equinus]|uniref:UDP-N-acetylenolpyruvoylglucosamine reductase n=1 Tax=Peptostreptococcus equinus TaxID=3003601 RepID=A0ABY7JR58_9FIRM|nr:UDP-N-acetylmuramate dehydrogenase [Peptostreptococcus sp. CBA3647]WAW15351.1 UDP-N-acetylmuramate dehydrogenase [Peptostreptococcus sp. CBA3647]
MDKLEVYERLREILDEEKILVNEPMHKHISFKVGGPADILVRPTTEEEIKNLLIYTTKNEIPFIVKGNGSNILIKDGGFRGLVIELSDNFSDFNFQEDVIEVQSGALLSVIGKEAMGHCLTGFEFASGIPGTLGGALAMNAGAYDGEMKHVVKSVRLMDMHGNVKEYSNEDMRFGYRHSLLTDERLIAISAKIQLENGDYNKIKEKMDDLTNRRRTKQPLEYPSAGSTFKRPTGYYAGKLIQDSDLKGYSYGGAQVSEKHSGFVINYKDASAGDIIGLIEHIKLTVYEKHGVKLEEEVKILGEEDNKR